MLFGITEVVADVYINFGLQLLESSLKNLHAARVEWPSKDYMAVLGSFAKAREPLLPHAFAMVDGLNLRVDSNVPALPREWSCARVRGYVGPCVSSCASARAGKCLRGVPLNLDTPSLNRCSTRPT